jgi:hypothetical protein
METTSPQKKSWKRKSNIVPGGRPENKYNFSTYLHKVGDWVETHPLTEEEYQRIRKAAFIWGYRHNCRMSIRKKRIPGGFGALITLIRNYF